ncbi:Transcription factor [Mycena venus]|uniref:RNA-directed DNA polymerase n=1 Tax=Mycena venus TaxID=2733690 RepID=A0A8H6Z872_9AGAR|nr:Transcription factor [Mycena venus]
MPLRSGTKHTVATPPSSEGSLEGNVGMDAQASTPTDGGTMGHSAIEPRSSSQDSAAESERRSRSADVDENGATVMSELPGSHPLAYQDGGVMSDDPNAYRAGRATEQQDAQSSVDSGFRSPKKTSRASSAGRSSPALDTTPKFFGTWFNPEGVATDEADAEGNTMQVKAGRWADFSDDDGLGEIPADWSRDIKVEPISPQLPPTPSACTLSPVDSGDEFSLDGLMSEVEKRMPEEAQQLLARREAKMKKTYLKPATSVSETTSERVSNGVSVHAVNVFENGRVPSMVPHPSRSAASTPRIPAAAKGKGRDPREGPGIPAGDRAVPTSETGDQEDRERQIQADALLAMYLQRKLEKDESSALPMVPNQLENRVSGSGIKFDEPAKWEHQNSSNLSSEDLDRIIAQKLREHYAENERRLRAEIGGLKAKLADAKVKKTNADKRADSKHAKTPTPMDQIPPTSNLYHAMQDADPDSSDSSSSTSSENKPRRSRKSSKEKSKRGARKGSKKRSKKSRSHRRNSPPPSDDPYSSSDSSDSTSSSSSSSDTDSDWGSLGPEPSEVSSNDSARTKRQKKRARKEWRMKLLRLKLEHSNARPEPPSVYNGEAKFRIINRWQLEVRDWAKYSYIRKNMIVSRLQKYLGGRALAWYMREVANNPKKWSLNRFFTALFNYCLPVEFRSIQRAKFNAFEQRGHPIGDYRIDLEELRNSVGGDITDRQLVVRFWEGADMEIRLKWAEAGFDPEFSNIDELETAGRNFQRALKLRESQSKGKGSGADKKGRKNHEKSVQNLEGVSSKKTGRYSDRPTHKDKDSKRHGSGKPSGSNFKAPKLSKAQMAEFRAQGKCFTCESTEHIAKDCPKRNTLKPTKITAATATVDLAEVDRLAKLRKLQSIGVFAVSVEEMEPSHELTRAVSNVLVARMKADLTAEVPFVFDRFDDPEDDPMREDRFGFIETQLGWLVCDDHNNDHHEKCKIEDQLKGYKAPGKSSSAGREEGQQPTHLPRDDLPDTFRQFLSDAGLDPDHPGGAEEVITALVDEFRAGVPYTFDPHGPADREAQFSPGRFIVEYSAQDFLLVEDLYMNLGYELKYTDLLNPDWDATWWLEEEYALMAHLRRWVERQEEDSDDEFSDDDFFDSDDDLPPPPPPAAGTAVRAVDSDSEQGDPPDLQKAVKDDSDIDFLDSEDDEIPELEDVSDSESESDDEPACANAADTFQETLTTTRFHEVEAYPVSNVKSRKSAVKEDEIYTLERNASRVKDYKRLVPKPVIVVVHLNGHPVRALIDSGSLADFVSTTLVDQLKLETEQLKKPLAVGMASSGSRTMCNYSVTARFQYQKIDEDRHFDVMNISNYDLILGTPFIYQHQVLVGLNPAQVAIGSIKALPIVGEEVVTLASHAADILEDKLEILRKELHDYAADLCVDASKTPLPPLRAINHKIPLIDENKTYSYRPSKCPDPLKQLWREKRDAYLATGRWKVQSGHNAVPMLMLKKPSQPGDKTVRMRTVFDCRERNSNTRKMASPLPDIEGILRNCASHPFRSQLDNKEAYEQIRVEPDHVERTLFNTPDGTMASLVIQQGDCNGGATYQALMNHLFAPYIGKFMDVYLDDIFIYSDTAEDHMKHVKIVIDILRKEKLYLNGSKIHFFVENLNILGHVIDENGIKMDPHKVESIAKWPTPTAPGLLSGFLGAVGFLAPDCAGIRIPMGVLTQLTGSVPWRWSHTEHRAFEAVKGTVSKWRDHHRVTIDYSPGAPPVFLVTDACLTGGSGVVCQGKDLASANIVAFWSGKFNPAQQNYPVHDLEMLAIIESLKRFRNLLLGINFRIMADHKALQHFMTQKNLSPRQTRWLEALSEFDFKIEYIPGTTNILADALSRIYSADEPGTMRAASEFVPMDEDDRRVKEVAEALSIGTRPLVIGDPVKAALQAMPEIQDHEVEVHAATVKENSKRISKAKKLVKALPKVILRVRDPSTGEFVTSASNSNLEGGSSAKGTAVDVSVQTDPRETQLERPASMPSIVEEKEASTGYDPGMLPNEEIHAQTPEEELLSSTSPRLTQIISEGDPTVNFPACLVDKYSEDRFFQVVLEKPDSYKNFEVKDGLIFLRDSDRRILCIPDILIGRRNVRDIVISHAHSILAHLGPRKTLYYLKDNVWWKSMVEDVKIHCKSCAVCAGSKSNSQSPYGLLNPLPIPSRPWETIGIDFVGPLTESKNRLGIFDMIMVIICHFSAMVHLVPTKQTYRAKDIAELVFEHVYSKHGLPRAIVSDRNSLFTSIFWDKLHALIGTELKMSSSFHPQTDGATERANRTMVQMLRSCIAPHQKDWVTKLPGIEFAMNSARSETTGFSPFFLNTGRTPAPMIWDAKSEYPGVRVFAQRMKEAIMAAHDAIIHARVKQDDLVYLSTKNLKIPKNRSRKLAPKYIGPYRIVEDYGNNTFKLDLPSELKSRDLSEAQAAAAVAAGKKVRVAGSLVIRLRSREKVDLAVAEGRVVLLGFAPTVVRSFPHLRVTQCWGCLKFGHVKAKCSVKSNKCASCGEASHGANIAEHLRLRAVHLTKLLDASSSIRSSVSSSAWSSAGLSPAPNAPRLHDLINSWKSRNPLEILAGPERFDIICTQEPHEHESLNICEHPGYVLIYPEAAPKHRVSIYVRLASIPACDICPRLDLSSSGDIIVVDFIFGNNKVTVVNLYNDSETRAGVGILRAVLAQLAPNTHILVIMDSNSHHVLWDSRTKTKLRIEDFELHDLLVANPSLPFLLVTPPDVPTHISGNVIDLGFCSPSLFMSVRDVVVDPDFCVGSDHLPIRYTLDFKVTRGLPFRFNNAKMDLENFLAVLRHRLGSRPQPTISTQTQLDEAVTFLCEVLRAALDESTPRHRPSSLAKRWWTPRISALLATVRRARRRFQKFLVDSARQLWLQARRELCLAISTAKQEAWFAFVKDLERADLYKAVKRLRNQSASVFPGIRDTETGDIALSHADRGRILGRAWFGTHAAEVSTPLLPDVTSDLRADPAGSGTREKARGAPNADSHDPIQLAKTIHIPDERPFIEVPDSEVDHAILSSSPWKAPDRYGVQMGHVQRAWPIINGWVREIFKASARLGIKPTPFKANVATPFHKQAKKDKTSPKAWRPVENYEHILAKPLERLIADRISFEAESLGFIDPSQYGGRPGHSTTQAVDGYVHRVRAELDRGNTVSTLFYDLKGAFNRISHVVIVRELAELGFSRETIQWVASFLHEHLVTVVIDGVRTTTFRCLIEGAPQGSALSVILFLLTINRLLRRLRAIGVIVSWAYGFVDDTNFSTASASPSQNVSILNKAAEIAAQWAADDHATFEKDKTELMHHTPGRRDLSDFTITFDGQVIRPSRTVKWIGVILDEKLKGEDHIRARAASAARALNASLALTHAMWGLKPLMIRDLVLATVLPRADYGVSSFFPLSPAALKPLDRINKSAARCITGAYRTASLAALEKEAALLPASLRLELALQNRLARYLTLPHSHGLTPLLQDAIASSPRNPRLASPLHYLERLPVVRWPNNVPAQGLRIRDRRKLPRTDPPEVTAVPRADQTGSGARKKRGGTVNEPSARGLSPPPGGRQVPLAVPPVASTAHCSQHVRPTAPAGLLGMELILPVYSPPWADPLPVMTAIAAKDSALEVLSAFLEDTDYAETTWFTDGSLLEGKAGGAAIRLEQGSLREEILVPLGDGQVMEGEVEGIIAATERAIQGNHHRILVVSDSQAGLQGIVSTAPRSGQFRAILYDQLLRRALLVAPHLRITNLWTPAHIGTCGNELADIAAKAATLLPASPSVPVSLTTCRRRIREDILRRWDVQWGLSTTGRALRQVDRLPPFLILRHPYTAPIPRPMISIISRLRTDFSPLNATRFRLRQTNSPACDACGAPETRAHFLLQCPAWEHLRPALQRASYAADILGAVDVPSLLTNAKLLKALVDFISATGRFS